MAHKRFTVLVLLLPLFAATAQANSWKVQTSGMDSNLRAVSAVHFSTEKGVPTPVVWASGSNGVILKSVDEGKSWQRLHVQGGGTLDFRGVVAFNNKTAYLMSSGEGDKSRIYKTIDGGETWELQVTDKHKEFFLDSIACLSETHCVALGDPIGGKFLLLTTTDGEHWKPLATTIMPASLPGEGAFAASNSCLALFGEEIFFATGGLVSRVFVSKNLGLAWWAVNTPIAHANASSGIFSVARLPGPGPRALVVVGGDHKDPARASAVAAFSGDRGKAWKLAKRQPRGFRSAVAALDGLRLIAVGPNGEEISEDRGVHWKQTDSLNLNALAILDAAHGWAVGPNGTIARFVSP